MITYKPPYYWKNKKWYYYDPRYSRYRLTDNATQKAIDSFIEFNSLYVFWGDNSPEFISHLFKEFKQKALDDIKDFKENNHRYSLECKEGEHHYTLVAVDGKKV